MDRYDGFAEFARARDASISRTAYLLTGDAARAAALLASALTRVARGWPQISASGDPETAVRTHMARRPTGAAAPHSDELAHLTGRSRAVAVLRDYHRHSVPEIAAMLDCSEATVRHLSKPVPPGALDALASGAGSYADPSAAVSAARRERRRLMSIPLLVAVLIAGGAAAIATSEHQPTMRPPAPSPSTPSALALPDRVVVPVGGVPTLPTDRGVGRALLAYRACPSACAAYLLTQNGTQFRLPVDPVAGDCCLDLTAAAADLPVSISPDGRWLATATGSGVEVRDLTGTAVRTADVNFITAWSPDGQFVLGASAGGIRRVDLRIGSSDLVDEHACGITDGGRVQSALVGLDGTSISIQITDPDISAAITGDRVLHRAEALWLPTTSDDRVEVRFGADGWYAATVFGLTARQRTAVILGNYTDGSLGIRADVPTGAGTPFFFGPEVAFADQVAAGDPITIVGIAPGGTVNRSQLPARAEFVIAGQGQAMSGPAQSLG